MLEDVLDVAADTERSFQLQDPRGFYIPSLYTLPSTGTRYLCCYARTCNYSPSTAWNFCVHFTRLDSRTDAICNVFITGLALLIMVEVVMHLRRRNHLSTPMCRPQTCRFLAVSSFIRPRRPCRGNEVMVLIGDEYVPVCQHTMSSAANWSKPVHASVHVRHSQSRYGLFMQILPVCNRYSRVSGR